MRPLWQPWAILFLGVCLTLGAWLSLRQADRARIEAAQGAQAQVLAERLGRRMEGLGFVLKGAAHYLAREPRPGRAEWHAYVESLGLLEGREGVRGLSFVAWIPRGDLAAHERAVQAQGFPDYRIRPGGTLPPDPDGLSSILYLEPLDELNLRALARDMWAEPLRREAMARARDTGLPALTAPLRLYQEGETGAQAGLVFFTPVYRGGVAPDTVAQRRAALVGWATCVLRMGEFLGAMVREEHARLDLDLADTAVPGEAGRLYDSDPGESLGGGGRVFRHALDVAGRTWSMEVRQRLELTPGGGPPLRWEVLFGGLAVSLVAGGLALALRRAERRASALADARGASLRVREAQVQALMSAAPLGLALLDGEGARLASVNPGLAAALGHAPEDLAGRSLTDLLHPEDPPLDLRSAATLDSGIRTRKERERRLVHRDGHEVWVRLRLLPMPDEPGARGRRLLLVEDLTDLRRAAAAEARSEALARSVLDAMPASVALLDEEGVIVEVNRGWREFALANGGDPAAVGPGASYLGAIPGGEGFAGTAAGLREVIDGSRPNLTLEYLCTTLEGPRWFHAVATPVPGRPGCLVTHLDITRIKEAEAGLREREELFRSLFELSPDPITLSDLSTGTLLQVNQAWCDMLGLERERALGRSSVDLGTWVDAKDREQLVAELRTTGRVVAREADLRRLDGETRRVVFTARVLDLQGRRCVLVLAKDITGLWRMQRELEEREARFRLLAEHSRDLVFRYRYLPEPGFEYLSPSVEALTGHPAAAFLADPDLYLRIVHPEDRDQLLAALTAPAGPLRLRTRWFRPDGSLLWTDQLLTVQHDAEGRVVAVQGSARDITAEVAARQELEAQLERYTILMETSQDAIHVLDREGRLRFWNPAFLAHLGITGEQAAGLAAGDWDCRLGQAGIRGLLQGADGAPQRFETDHRRADGTVVQVEISACGIRIGEEPLILASARDISDRVRAEAALREREAMFRAFFEQNLAVKLLVDPVDGRIVDANPAAVAFYGWDRERLLALRIQDINQLPEEEVMAAMRLARLRQSRSFRFRHRLASGQVREVEVYSSPVPHAGRDLLLSVIHDVTDRVRAEAALAESEARLRLLADQLPDSFVYQLAVAPGRPPHFVHLSAGVERIAGIRREDALGDPSLLFGQIDPAMAEAYARAEAVSRETGRPFDMDLRVRRGDGAWRWFHVRSQPRSTPGGGVVWDGIASDVTEAREGRLALAETEARWKFALEGSGLAVWDWWADRPRILVNARYGEMLGRPDLVHQGLSHLEWLDLVDPEDRERVIASGEDYLSGRVQDYGLVFRMRHQLGTTVWVESRGLAVSRDASGRPTRIIGSHLDVTDRMRAEEQETRFQQVVEQAADPIFLVDHEGRIRLCNESASRVSGYGRDELLTLRVADLAPGLRGQEAGLWRSLRSVRHARLDSRFRRADGSDFPVEVHLGRLGSAGTRMVLAVVRDLSERIQAQEAELRARKAESLVLMAGSIAHDFNNLFQALLASLDLAELKAKGDPAVNSALRTGREVLRRAVGLSWKMLDFSGRAAARLQPMDLGAWLHARRGALEAQVGAGRLLLQVEEVPPIYGDGEKLGLVLEALLANAREATADGGGGVRLSLRLDLQEDRPVRSPEGLWAAEPPPGPATVLLEVADGGPGASPEVLSRMFDPFYTTRELGRGLGLPSALGLLQAHRAGVHAFNGPEGGLVLRLHFPPAGP